METAIIDWINGDQIRRVGWAAIANLIGLATVVTRTTTAVDWSITAPTVALFWMWAALDRFPRWPLYVMGFACPIALNLVEVDSEVSTFFLVLSVALMASTETNRQVIGPFIGVTVATIVTLSLTGAWSSEFGWQNWLFGLFFAWLFGEMMYRYTHTISALRQTRGVVADQAAAHERRRIARDVHDLVGHSLSVVMLHVTGARHLVHRDPDEAERALEQAEAAGRESLAEIRRTIALLRDDSDIVRDSLPSPDLTDIRDLVDEFASAGLDVVFESSGSLEAITGATGVAGYRITQEALTNATRHTTGAHVVVKVHVNADRISEVSIVNQGGMQTGVDTGSGFGLIGMRERARSVGGSLITGPSRSGWSVEASLPDVSRSAAL